MNQLCKVCAEPAAGFHFGAFTCEGCKSFFGRTYNNLSQIHECKNGGQCIINKQNRTSCKACRLRKCLVVGMSKTGSRYGRRSNWFKTICLLQEQCAYSNPASAPSFRSPVTPTLQDGSLPFVNSQLRDALHTMEVPMGSLKQTGLRVPISSPHTAGGVPTVPSCSVVGAGGGTCSRSEPTDVAASYALGHMEAVERQLQEEALKSLKRDTGLTGSDLEAAYREHLLEALRRSHGDQEARQFDGSPLPSMRRAINDSDHIGRVEAEFSRDRRTSADNENTRLTTAPPFGWDQRLSEASLVYSESEAIKSTSSCASQVSLTISVSTARHSDCSTTCSPIRLEPRRNNFEVIDNKILTAGSTQCSTSGNRSPSRMTPKNEVTSGRLQEESEVPMTEEERLSFLKNASKISSNNCVSIDANRTNNFQGIPIIPPRLSPRDDILYGPMNNNIFPFPSYPPVWPSILPFPAFARFYPPFPAPAIPGSPVPFDGFKNPAYLPPELRNAILSKQAYELPKVDPINKKRILDAILQVQRENSGSARSPPRGMSPSGLSVPRCLPIQITSSSAVIPVVTSAATIEASAVMGDQPIDLTVRRKRKMAKSEIMYQPKDGPEHDMQSGFEREVVDEERQREEREKEEALTDVTMTKEIFVQGKSEIVDLKSGLECASSLVDNKFEVPLKIIKLETAGDTLIA